MKVAMISPLPAVADEPPESGVAAYTAALVGAMSGDAQITVLAQKAAAGGPLGSAKVARIWTPNTKLPMQVKTALASVRPDVLHLQHEFNLYGGLVQGTLLTLMLMFLRRRGMHTVTTVHGVVAPEEVTPEFLGRNALPPSSLFVRTAFRIAYRAIDLSSDLLIVHHPHFRDVLMRSYGIQGRKVVIIPMGAPVTNGHSRIGAHLPGREILALGFLTGYKAPEVIVDVAESDAIPGATFNFCVGANPRISSHRYRNRYRELERRVRAVGPRAKWSGYVPNELLAGTVEQADVMVLPYTECVSVSAVAALAGQSNTPICYSRALRPLFGPGPLEFELNAPSLADAILRAFSAGAKVPIPGFATWPDAARTTHATWVDLVSPR